MRKPALEKYQKKVQDSTYREILLYGASLDEFTVIEIGQKLKKSLPTIHTCFKHFEEKNYIKRVGKEEGKMGRKSFLWSLTILEFHSLAIEIHTSHITLAIHNLKGKIFYKNEIQLLNHQLLIETIVELIHNSKKNIPLEIFEKIESIGIAVSGIVDTTKNMLIYSSNLDIENIDFTLIEDIFGWKVFLENNANAGVLGEFFLTPQENKNIIYINVSEQGIGAGIITEHKLQKGAMRRSGEIGHMSINYEGKECSCGNRGCLERYICEQGFMEIVQKYIQGKHTIEEVFQAPPEILEKIIEEYIFYLEKGLRNLLFIFDPSSIIIGGFIAHYWDKCGTLIKEALYKNNHIYKDKKILTIEPAKFQENAALIGVGLLPFYNLFYEEDVFM